MEKLEIKNILLSLQNEENFGIINNLLGKIDLLDNETIDRLSKQVGNTENSIRTYLKHKIDKQLHKNADHQQEHKPINEMITYGKSGNSIHLHLPGDLHSLIQKIGISKTISTVNLYLIDAIDKIKSLKDNGYKEFDESDSIYMISPVLVKNELKFLQDLGFNTNSYSKKELSNPEFVKENTEAQLAVDLFGNDKNVSSALISMDKLSSVEYQEIKKAKIEKINKQGIYLDNDIER